MSSGIEIHYIKGEKNTEVKEPNVTLGDILTMECSNSSIMQKLPYLFCFTVCRRANFLPASGP